jgi:hypothetical protein
LQAVNASLTTFHLQILPDKGYFLTGICSAQKLALSLAWVLACALLPSAANAGAYVLGDSIGEGLADASGLHKLAHISIHIRGPKAITQINATPVGSVAFIVLGTNDADGDGSIKNLGKSIDEVIRAGARRRLKMVWIGPPCVRRSFDTRSREVDHILHDRLANTPVQYISMRDEHICSGNFHEPDGVHLTMKGYHYMWDKVRAAVSWPVFATAGVSQQSANPLARADVSDATASTPAAAPTSSGANSAEIETSQTMQMLVEVHKPARALNSAIVWSQIPD